MAKILQNGAKFRYAKADFNKIRGIWTTSDKHWKVQKVEIRWAFVQKSTFLQLKYIQWIYLILLSTTCVQIHQITYVIFETISYFSQQKASVSFQLKHYILSTKVIHQSENFQTFPLLRLKFTKFLMSFFK